MNIVEISVSEGDSSIKLFNIVGNLLFPFLAFAGLGGLNFSTDFGRSKSKFQEILEIGITFADVVGADQASLYLQEVVDFLKTPK